jgi:hypothetical protein
MVSIPHGEGQKDMNLYDAPQDYPGTEYPNPSHKSSGPSTVYLPSVLTHNMARDLLSRHQFLSLLPPKGTPHAPFPNNVSRGTPGAA